MIEQLLGSHVVAEMRRIVREEIAACGPPATTDRSVDERLTKLQAARAAGVSITTLDRWRKSGALPFTGKGRLMRFKLADVMRALESGSVDTFDAGKQARKMALK